MKIRQFFEKIDEYIAQENRLGKDYSFNIEVEDIILDNFKEIEKENEDFASYLNDDVLDYCASIDPSVDEALFKRKLMSLLEKGKKEILK